jgi:hypothetical protein
MYLLRVLSVLLAAVALAWDAPALGESAQEVWLERATFDPSAGDSVTLSHRLDQRATAVLVYDPDGGLIRTLPVIGGENPGAHPIVWDGRDDAGVLVPDEAYTFVIETADGGVYDPTTFSGGEVDDIRDPSFSDSGVISYSLPVPARVLIRLGIRNGPMYRTLVDWKPRPAGKVNEQWDGFDREQLVKLREQDGFTGLITYVTLPEVTVIAYGNEAETYREYKLGRGKGRPQKPQRAFAGEEKRRYRPDSLVPPAWARAPRVELAFPHIPKPDAVPVVEGAVDVRIDVAEEDKPQLMEDQFEVLLFVDGQFFAEAERGYLPLNWKWELSQFSPGEHILTVNVSSFKGQVGVASRKVRLAP